MCGKTYTLNCKICKIEMQEKSGCCRDGSKILGFCRDCSNGIFTKIFDIWRCEGLEALCEYWLKEKIIKRDDLIRDLKDAIRQFDDYPSDDE